MSLGLAVTWDNPDIILLRNGVIVAESDLLPNTEYEIRATIWNNSYEAPVVGLQVDFSYLSFGAGTVNTPIDTKFVNLGVKGGVGHPAHGSVFWTTPPAGHYCILVTLKCADDLNPANNVGQNNVDVVAAQSPATFAFQLRNDTERRHVYRFEVDAYTLPPQPQCPAVLEQTSNTTERWKSIQAMHDRKRYPMPSGWSADFSPAQPPLQPGDEITVNVSLSPPTQFTGRQPVNINAFTEAGTCAGGVTVYVTKF
jgi:hypothetical protein